MGNAEAQKLMETPITVDVVTSPGLNGCREEELWALGEGGVDRELLDPSRAFQRRGAARPWRALTSHSSLPAIRSQLA